MSIVSRIVTLTLVDSLWVDSLSHELENLYERDLLTIQLAWRMSALLFFPLTFDILDRDDLSIHRRVEPMVVLRRQSSNGKRASRVFLDGFERVVVGIRAN